MPCVCDACGRPCDCGEKYCESCLPFIDIDGVDRRKVKMIPPVRWFAKWCGDGTKPLPHDGYLEEFDKTGKETIFSRESVPREGLCQLGLIVKLGDHDVVSYFDMNNGRVFIRSLPLWLMIDVDGRLYEVTRRPVIYEPIQFKQGYINLGAGAVGPIPTVCQAYNVGWKAKIDVGGRLFMVKAILTVDASSLDYAIAVHSHEVKDER